jgi:Restriction endonuclease S subunits
VIKNHIPKSWESICLGNITYITYGKGLPTKKLLSSGFPVFGANGIIGFYDRYLYEDSQLLISCRGASSGEINFSPPKCFVTNNSLIVDFPFQAKILRKTFYYFLQAVKKDRLVTGSAQPQVTINNAIELKLNLPPLNEQKRIVAKIEELFSELDNGIAALKTAREQLNVYRQAVLKHAFEGKLTAKWREKNADKLESPEQLLARIQQEREACYQEQLEDWMAAVKEWEANGKEGKKPGKPKTFSKIDLLSNSELMDLPELPDGYIYIALLNLGDLSRGKSKHRPRNDPRLFGGKYPFIQTAEVKSANRIINKYHQTYSDFGLAQSKLWPSGTLCITIAANIAETSFLGFDCCFPDSIVGFTAYKSVIPEYVELFIKAVRVNIEAYAPATAQKNINLVTLENLVVPYCSIDEQKKIINEVEAIFSVIDNNEKEIESALTKAATLRQSILKKAFSGQLVPQDPSDEPASKLLARIQAEKEFVNTQKTSKSNKRHSVSSH